MSTTPETTSPATTPNFEFFQGNLSEERQSVRITASGPGWCWRGRWLLL